MHCNGTDVADIRTYTAQVSEKYQTPFHMAGMTLVDAVEALGFERIALNSVYYWPDWRDGLARFLASGGLDVMYAGNFVDLHMVDDQDDCNSRHWCFPESFAVESVVRTAEHAPNAEVIVINGMPNFRNREGVAERALHHIEAMEAAVGKPVIASDTTLYWAIYRTRYVQHPAAAGQRPAGLPATSCPRVPGHPRQQSQQAVACEQSYRNVTD